MLGSAVEPLPLYSGTTLVLRHDVGGNVSIALLFKNFVMHDVPSFPKCFRSCRGSLLNPELLFALNWYCSTSVSSASIIWCALGYYNGLNLSVGMVASMNMCSFYSANSFIGISD